MATQTTNYGFKKPAAEEFFNVADINGNMDLIDGALSGLEASKETPAGAQAKADAAEAAAKAASVPTTRKVNNKALSSDVTITASDVGAIPTAQKGSASGVAELGSDGRVPAAQLPSYVDDVLEYASMGSFPGTGETGKIYIAKDTNRTYRWGGSSYVEISQSLALGETSSTAYRGDRGKTAYDHSQTVGDAHGLKQAVPVTTSGTGSALTATISGLTLSDGVTLRLKLHTAISAGATLNVNGTSAIAIRDVKGNAVKAGPVTGSYLTLIYNGSNFILQGEGGEYGTAGAAQVLAGYTVGTENGLVNGTMPNRPYAQAPLSYWTDGNGLLRPRLPVGAYITEGGAGGAGTTEIDMYDADFVAANIRSGKNIFNLQGADNVLPVGGILETYKAGENISQGDLIQILNGSPTSVTSIDSQANGDVKGVKMSDTSALVVYEGSAQRLYAVALSISGSTITRGSPVQVASRYFGGLRFIYLSNNTALIAYTYNNSDPYPTYVAAIQVSGLSVASGSAVDLGGDSYRFDITRLTDTTALVALYRYARVLTISGTSISVGSQYTVFPYITTSSMSISALSPTQVAIFAVTNSALNGGCGVIVNVSGTSLSAGSSYNFTTAITASNLTARAITSDKILLFWKDSADSNDKMTICTISGTAISYSFTIILGIYGLSTPLQNSVDVISSSSIIFTAISAGNTVMVAATVDPYAYNMSIISQTVVFSGTQQPYSRYGQIILSTAFKIIVYSTGSGDPKYANMITAVMKATNKGNINGIAKDSVSSGGNLQVYTL